MRYLPMILGAGLLSAALLAGSDPAQAAMPMLAFESFPLPRTRRSRRSTTTDTLGGIIAVTITAMAITITTATTGPTMVTATAGTMVTIMVMGVAGATKTGRNTILVRGFNRSRWRPRPGHFPPPDQPAG